MEFKEGVHKSSVRETMFEPEPEPGSGRSPNKRARWLLALVLLVCIVVGSVVSFQMLRNRLNAITEIAPDNVWAIGSVLQTPQSPNSLGDFLAGIHTLIEHWDGHQWSIVPSPDAASSSNELLSVAAVSADDIWAVGYSFHDALVEHWNGSQWSVMKFPASFHSTVLKAVIAPAKDDIWVAGYADAPTGQSLVPLLAHWDGVSLQQKTLPKLLLQVKQGSYGTSIPVYQDQASISVHSLNDVWVAGGQFGSALSATDVPVFIEHWDGQSWKVASLPQENVGQLNVLAVVDGKVWAAGTTYKGLQHIPDQLAETTC